MVESGLRTKKLLRLRNDKNEVYYSGILKMILLWSKSYLINVNNKENGFDLFCIPKSYCAEFLFLCSQFTIFVPM